MDDLVCKAIDIAASDDKVTDWIILATTESGGFRYSHRGSRVCLIGMMRVMETGLINYLEAIEPEGEGEEGLDGSEC